MVRAGSDEHSLTFLQHSQSTQEEEQQHTGVPACHKINEKNNSVFSFQDVSDHVNIRRPILSLFRELASASLLPWRQNIIWAGDANLLGVHKTVF